MRRGPQSPEVIAPAREAPRHNLVFGPVPSRRLGRSLGVDLVPFKTCTYDCIYCQLARTTRLTVERIQAMTKIPIAVLTNGSLLWQHEVREELALADVVLPSLDAGGAFTFTCINRPQASLSFETLVEGLVAFRRAFSGQYWLEVFLWGGTR